MPGIARAAMPAHARDISLLMKGLGTERAAVDIRRAMTQPRSVWTVVETGQGAVLGVQWIEAGPERALAEIATFTAEGAERIAVGSALFEVTRAEARRLGYRWLIADLAAANSGAIVYYRSRGFEPVTGRLAGPRGSGRMRLGYDLR
ncbi:hypothetical protein N8I71_06495 [Roseibacterium sp. SDUM158016]|jgi:GNAT superfamily N-acetyltransferase|uniref:GNAT family N-acetyltransferase n=1 Tax=Roseicyclus sediminis TaxID=2980997 RepID=UPI0021D01B8F|nr:hypothetical protein [Roseibacterium sp. SDUM158016]MCU4652473.1 hypothetical protein [Roseibacterium sp. SDUM158016]